MLLRLCVETVEAGLVHLLAICGRDADEEVEELRRSSVDRSRVAFDRRHENFAESMQGCGLLLGEEVRVGAGYGVGDDRGYR